MLRVLPFVLFLGIWLFALIDCVMTPEREVRNLPKIAWLVVIVLTLVIGNRLPHVVIVAPTNVLAVTVP